MHPHWFFQEVVVPNIRAVEAQGDDVRAVVNAVLTLDALVGILYDHLRMLGSPEVADAGSDDVYRECLAQQCPGYSALRDAAAALKHGSLTHPRRGKPPRLIRTPDRIQTTEAVLGPFSIDDELGGHVAILCLEDGTDAVRVDDAIAATCRMLSPVLNILPGAASRPA